MNETAAKFVQISIEVNPELGIASAILSQSAIQSELTVQQLQNLIAEKRIADWLINEQALDEVVKKFHKATVCQIAIAERKNASCSLTLADDKMSATAEFQPAFGGNNLSAESIQKALKDKGIDQKRINLSAINQLITAKEKTSAVVATGKPPVTGRDSTFVELLDNPSKDAELNEDEQGNIDYLAGKEYLTVQAGTPLMERIPPQPGRIGMDIFGQIIPANSGKEAPFNSKLEGTELSPDNPNIIIAKIDGHPVYFADGVNVDDTLTFDTININTGHVKFDGSIHVKGDIQADMKVEVTGDIFVKGVVEKAELIAGNNITVAGGILGDNQTEVLESEITEIEKTDENGDIIVEYVEENEPQMPDYKCTVKAGGIIQARYVNLAHVEAGHSINIREYAFNAYLKANMSILLGQEGGKGNLVGGNAVAGHSVIGKTLGSKAYNKTSIRVGITRAELQQIQKLKFTREQRLMQARTLKRLLEELKRHGKTEKLGRVEIDKARKVHDTLLSLQDEIRGIDLKIHSFELAKFIDDEPNISSTSACFPNCAVVINGALLQTKQEHKAITFVKRGRRITAKT